MPIRRWMIVGLGVVVCREALSQPCPRWIRVISRPGISGASVKDMVTFDSPTGPLLIAGGDFQVAGTSAAQDIASWNGSNWQALGLGTDQHVRAVEQFDDGTGPVLVMGGSFIRAGLVPAQNIAQWDGTQWSSLLPGGQGTTTEVWSMAVYDDGGGEELYVGTAGVFWAGNGFFQYIAKWDGTNWSDVGGGLTEIASVLEVLDDGNGEALYAGGTFTVSQGARANYVAKWDGLQWTSLGDGPPGRVHALAVFDDGTGPAIYAGGEFRPAGSIVRWDGSTWTELDPGGVTGAGVAEVHALQVFDDGGGDALFVAGQFDAAGGMPSKNIAKWDGAWHPVQHGEQSGLASGSTGVPIRAMHPFGGFLTIAGKFTISGCENKGAVGNIVQLGCSNGCYADCDQTTGTGVLDIFDFLCFQSAFVVGDLSSDCNQDCQFDIFDFLCFQDAFVGGCQ